MTKIEEKKGAIVLTGYTYDDRTPQCGTKHRRHANVELAAVSDSAAIVQTLSNYCNILRDDELSYGDYVSRLCRYVAPMKGLASPCFPYGSGTILLWHRQRLPYPAA